MKKILLCIAVVLSNDISFAGDDVVPLRRGDRAYYHPVPRGTNGVLPLSGGRGRNRTLFYVKPTQHYYTKSNVVSYRYVEDRAARGTHSVTGSTYDGPRGAVFVPGDDYSSRNASIRTFADVNERPQPGVAMIPHQGTPDTTVPKRSRVIRRR